MQESGDSWLYTRCSQPLFLSIKHHKPIFLMIPYISKWNTLLICHKIIFQLISVLFILGSLMNCYLNSSGASGRCYATGRKDQHVGLRNFLLGQKITYPNNLSSRGNIGKMASSVLLTHFLRCQFQILCYLLISQLFCMNMPQHYQAVESESYIKHRKYITH